MQGVRVGLDRFRHAPVMNKVALPRYPIPRSGALLVGLSSGCRVIGSRTVPVEEVIRDGENRVLVDFFDVEGIVGRVLEALEARERRTALGEVARVSVKRFDVAEAGRGYQSVVMPDSRGKNSMPDDEKGVTHMRSFATASID